MNLRGRQVLVTGGTSGIGLALCDRLSALDCQVLTCGRDATRLAESAGRLSGVSTIEADLARPEHRRRLVAEVQRQLPDLSVVINNAGVQILGDWFRTDPPQLVAEVHREIETNLVAPLELTATLLPLLARADEAALVNLTSGLAVVPKRSAPVYCATKAALRSFSTSLRYQAEASAPTVRVVEVVLPLVDTPMTAGRGRRKLSPDRVAAEIIRGIEGNRDTLAIGAVTALLAIHWIAPPIARRILRDS